MAAQSLVQLRGFFESLPGGSKNISPPDMQNTVPPGVETQVILTTGANTIAVPSLSTVNSVYGAILVFNPSSTVVKTVQGDVGDVGIKLNPGNWNVITFDPTDPPANLIITASAQDSYSSTVIFF